ncbi:hypothetical protein DM01DRAFT_1339574 [Hesseltinella vesiculosa]|uniref:Uncharacterized protein n=1 Tax=Hesseltinella vesiculosa TaxID=101127 RepID=A0A1X2G6X4_9FUNG|nr:hypothetical protein DM01DRAFT_1339574 [Hesseltinella vesiculosa]
MPSLELLEGVNGLATQYMTEYPDSEPALKDAFDAQALVFLGMLVEENVKYNMTSFHDKYDQVSQSINQQVHARMTRNLNTFAQDPSSDDASDNNDDAGSSSSSSTSSSSDGIQDSSD